MIFTNSGFLALVASGPRPALGSVSIHQILDGFCNSFNCSVKLCLDGSVQLQLVNPFVHYCWCHTGGGLCSECATHRLAVKGECLCEEVC